MAVAVALLWALLAAAVYFRLVVSRLSVPSGLILSATIATVVLAAGPSARPFAVSLAAALAVGHLGAWLAGRRASAARLPAPPVVELVSASGSQPQPDAAVGAGGSLGRYVIDRPIGRGSMGLVYLGHDPATGRQAAVKTMALGQEFTGAELVEARARFLREADMAGRLQHPDIVTVFEAGEDRGLAYIAMEFLAGHDLQAHTQARHLLPVPQVLHTVARVALALAHAHSQGVVHRDIKPANVMIDAAAGMVKVTDFGIARITDASRTRTRTGMLLGTPSYMAPEHMAGDLADGRADLYSLGVVLFQLLTGRLPHESSSLAALMRQIGTEAAPDVRSIRPELPQTLANVVALALEKRVAFRYRDGRQMAADLQAVAGMLSGPGEASQTHAASPADPQSQRFEATAGF